MQAQIIVNLALKLFPVILFFSSGFSHLISEEDSIYLFQQLDAEPAGRYVIGTLEVIAGFLMIMPGRSLEAGILGGILALGMVVIHLILLGTELNGDGNYRFALAIILLVSCWGIVFVHRKQIAGLPQKLRAIRWSDIKMP